MSAHERVYGKEGDMAASQHLGISSAAHALGNTALATEEARLALALAERTDVNASAKGPALVMLGRIALDLGQRARALEYLTLAQGTSEKRAGPESQEVAEGLVALAQWYLDGQEPLHALPLLEKALALQKRLLPPDSQDFGDTYLQLGRAHLQGGHFAEATTSLQESVRRLEASRFGPEKVAPARFALAQALWNGGGDRARAVQLARQARGEFARSEAAVAKELAQVDAWLAKRA